MRLPVRAVSSGGESISEREITKVVNLCSPSGRLNPEAVGWSRSALHRTNLRGWGRNKRFEYWSVVTPTSVLSLNISNHDYRANVSVGYLDRDTYTEIRQGGNTWLPRPGGMRNPDNEAPMESRHKDTVVRMTPDGENTRLYAESPRIVADLYISGNSGHESMGVVVPWGSRVFQYTKKDNCLRAEGTVIVDGVEHTVAPEASSAVHDRGRGRWPYFTFWNWGAGNGVTLEGMELGLQFGGKWTDGTPSTENWVRVGGILNKISEHLDWEYDPKNWLSPWKITGPSVHVTFTPAKHLRHLFNRWLIFSRGDTCLGHFSGEIALADGEVIAFSDVFGHVEEVERRW